MYRIERRRVRSNKNTTKRTTTLLALAALCATASPVLAVPLGPGERVALPGSCVGGGVVIRDTLVPFTIFDSFGASLSGSVQDRIIRQPDGTLNFEPRIRDVTGSSTRSITIVDRTGFSGFTTDVDWSTCSLGLGAPTEATRTGDGDRITYDFNFASIFRGQDSRSFRAITNADQFAVNGRMTLQLSDGTSTTITVAAPVIDTTPPEVRITSPGPESCVCPDAQGQVTISGVACDPESDMSYRVRIRRSSGADGTGWTELTPTTTERCSVGTLAQWNAVGQPDGEYIVLLEAINEVGLVSSAAIEIYYTSSVPSPTIRTPEPGHVIGGTVCIDGTVNPRCFSSYTVEYRTSGTGSYTPIDPISPIYTERVVNDPLGFWNTRTVADGSYDVRVRVTDPCGRNSQSVFTIEVDNTPPVARIMSITPCEWIGGLVDVRGEVFDRNLSSWVLEYTGGDERGWRTIATGSGNIRAGDTIAVWDTTSLPRCAYTVRLRATDTSRLGCTALSRNQTVDQVSVNVGCQADIDGDGQLTLFDFLAFQNLFVLGCP